jgi:hypothetical protein
VNIPHIEKDFRIICALINAFRPPRCQIIKDEDKTKASEMLKLSKMTKNPLKEIVEKLNSTNKS